MKRLVMYEFRKIWSQVTILTLASLILLITVLNLISYLGSSDSMINDNGEKVKGIKALRELSKEAGDIKGVINQEYLDNLLKEYNSSKQKEIFNSGDDLGYMKFIYPNYFINFVEYKEKMNNFTYNLDFDYLYSENEFYKKYRESASDLIKANNDSKGIQKYTDSQMEFIDEKIDKIETPFKVDYYSGLDRFIQSYGKYYWLCLISVGFALSSIFSKDSNNGIDELTLSSELGRNKNMNSRVIAGNIFSTVIYLIFVGVNLIEHGLITSLKGWGQSAQIYWHTCIYNISLGNGILIMLGLGLLGILVIANLVMMISINIKYSKLSTLISIGAIWWIQELTKTSNQLQIQLNPISFSTRMTTSNIVDFDIFYFIGNVMIPYSLIAIGISVIYILITKVFTVLQYKKYKLN